jgi:hypothetical protein
MTARLTGQSTGARGRRRQDRTARYQRTTMVVLSGPISMAESQ